MTEPLRANFELAIVLPLGVVANQLMRIEAELRFLNIKAMAYAKEGENGGQAGQIAAPLEKINAALELIRSLMSDIEADMRPKTASRADDSSGGRASRKPSGDRDD